MRASFAVLITGLCLTSSVSAQFVYGDGCPGGSGTEPTLVTTGLPIVDQEFEVVLTGVPNLPVVIGLGPNKLGNGVNVTEPGFEGCSLEVALTTTLFFTLPPDGVLVLPVTTWPVPEQSLFLQALVLDIGGESGGGLSPGLEIRSLAAPAPIVITEIMKDPDFAPDASGEWIELFNTTDLPIDIEGWMLADEGFDSTVLNNGGGGIIVPPGEYITLGNEGNPALNGGLTHAATYSGFSLANSADEVILVDGADDEVDRVEYLDNFMWPNKKGQALALKTLFTHDLLNDVGARWESSECYLAGTPFNLDRGTPGAANDLCTTEPPPMASGELIFSEVMQNPAQVPDSRGEWFELYNTTASPIDLQNYTIFVGITEVIDTPVVVEAGGYALFARNGDPSMNGGLPNPDFVWSTLGLGNGAVTMQLFDPNGDLVAFLSYDNGVTFPDPAGASMTLNPLFLDQDSAVDGANWCPATSEYGDGDLGTPGAPNDDCE